jgi:hypothetical protein
MVCNVAIALTFGVVIPPVGWACLVIVVITLITQYVKIGQALMIMTEQEREVLLPVFEQVTTISRNKRNHLCFVIIILDCVAECRTASMLVRVYELQLYVCSQSSAASTPSSYSI